MATPTPQPTRQQLDDLDALLQRMLALPVNASDEAAPPEPVAGAGACLPGSTGGAARQHDRRRSHAAAGRVFPPRTQAGFPAAAQPAAAGRTPCPGAAAARPPALAAASPDCVASATAAPGATAHPWLNRRFDAWPSPWAPRAAGCAGRSDAPCSGSSACSSSPPPCLLALGDRIGWTW